MGLYCQHIDEEDENDVCGNEIEGMFDPYCLHHMNMYPCKKCKHTSDEHDNKKTQEAEHCHHKGCKCKEYKGELTWD